MDTEDRRAKAKDDREGDGERAVRYRALMKAVADENPTLDWLMRDTAVNCYLDDETFVAADLAKDERVKDYKFYTRNEEEEDERVADQGGREEMGTGDGVDGLSHPGSGPVGRVDVRPVSSPSDGDACTGTTVRASGTDVDKDLGSVADEE
jgi:hypothetical protein